MLLSIRHRTDYRYDAPVRESVMELWVQPKQDANQRLMEYALDVEPAAQLFSYADFFGNAVYHFDVPQPHTRLTIRSTATVESAPAPAIPDRLGEGEWDLLRSAKVSGEYFDFLHPHGLAVPTAALEAFMAAHGLTIGAHDDPLTASRALSHRLSKALEYETGVTKADSPIDHALKAGRGVCQDFAHVMIAICRRWGVPARYVSGYLFTDRAAGDRSNPEATHAWVEVFLPTLGWIGMDPTNDIAAGERHIVVATGRDYADVPPSRGVYKGEAENELTVSVSVRQASATRFGPGFMANGTRAISSTRRRRPSPAALEQSLQQQQ